MAANPDEAPSFAANLPDPGLELLVSAGVIALVCVYAFADSYRRMSVRSPSRAPGLGLRTQVWFDIGSAESYLDAVSWTLDGGSTIAPSATVEGSHLEENVHVMDGATVHDASLRDTVVFPHATIGSSEIERSVVDEHALVSNTDLDGVLADSHTRLRLRCDGPVGDERPDAVYSAPHFSQLPMISTKPIGLLSL